jgi:hypothetical protein
MKRTIIKLCVFGAVMALFGLLLAACSEDTPLAPATDRGAETEKVSPVAILDGSFVPADQVTVDCFGQDLTFWPYTSPSLDGTPMDPVNLVFAGHADPLQIRAALLGLDGDRSLLGLPDAYPFNQVWKDALGGSVQTNWAEDGGWLGSVIQLTLGEYEPIRFHLRLFRTAAFGSGGETYTVGAAHFEVLIPGTTDHQVLSWKLAQDMVVGDLMRSGLLDPSQHLVPTQPIAPADWREIIPEIYNQLPDELIFLIEGPAKPVEAPVAISNGDGSAMKIYLAGAAPVAPGTYTNSTTVAFDQYVPRPYCSTGPGDWLYITGPVEFQTSVVVDATGTFNYEEGYQGWLTVLPLDMMTGTPVGDPFTAKVHGKQNGWMNATGARVMGQDTKLTHDAFGPQMQNLTIKVGEWNKAQAKVFERCFDAE